MQIESIEVRAVAPEVQRYTWSHDLPEQYMTNTVVRIKTDDGLEGVAGVSNYTSFGFDRYTTETLRHLAPILIGRDPLQRKFDRTADSYWKPRLPNDKSERYFRQF